MTNIIFLLNKKIKIQLTKITNMTYGFENNANKQEKTQIN